ncbi:MAG: F0F1 ATP synthase subunit gamma [Gammaproteobacteria bacterium]|nr:F0F1 ATP synthase subunit gamma [Gammaproteobacteria bacterium]
MSKRREVEGRIDALNEIRTIMESMRNLAMMESRKLARYHDMQHRVVESIGLAINSVRRHFGIGTQDVSEPPLYVLFGSERGFCGAYNEQLIACLSRQSDNERAPVIGVGARLASRLQEAYPEAVCLPGAAVADEVPAVLAAVVNAVNGMRERRGPLRLEVIHFTPESHEAHCEPVLPPVEASGDGGEPVIHLPPQELFGELLEHYLFAVTHAWFFSALMAENQRRMQHLDQAGHHLERQIEDLGIRRNVLRQEEIIEEIEVILLSSEAVTAPGDP